MTQKMAGNHSERVQQLFDEKAGAWSEKYAPSGRLIGRLARFSDAAAHHVRYGGAMLDLGCGTGDLARCLSERGYRVTGCDVSASMLAKATATDPASPVEWVKLNLDWQTLPFSDGAFDAVVASSVLEYTDSPAAVLAECARVVRHGAVVLATVPDLTHPVRWLEGMVHRSTILPGVRTAAKEWPRLDSYLTYLSVSRQRHSAAWWSLTAGQVGLVTLPTAQTPPERTPLRLLTFQQSIGNGAIR